MASALSKKGSEESQGPQIRHRTTTPTLALFMPAPSKTQDDVNYGKFVKHLLKPYTGRVRGIEEPPPGIICGHLVFNRTSGYRQKGNKVRFLCVKKAFRKFTWRCWFSMRRILDVVRRKDYLRDPADSVLNQRIEIEESFKD